MVLAVALGPLAAPAAAQSEAYAGTNVSFETESNAVVGYAVGGQTMVETMEVQSASEAESQGSVGVGTELSAVTDVGGSAVTLESSTQTEASLTTESGATLEAHDNGRGVLVVRSGGDSQYVTANVTAAGSAESAGESRVVVTNDDGTEGTFVVVGDGDVSVNEEGNVAARLEGNSKLVFRSYPEGRSDGDAEQERLIADGSTAAEVYVQESSESSGEFTADVVSYSEDTTVEVTEQSEGTIRMTAERSAEEGKVIITTVSEQAISSTDGLAVTVDGEAATEASSYSELQTAANGGETSKYMVRQGSSARASADVLVAVNHFSEREVAMSEAGSGSDGSSTPGQPGFGVGIAVLAIAAAALLARGRTR